MWIRIACLKVMIEFSMVSETIVRILLSLLDEEGIPKRVIHPDLPLLESGLDSLGFAVLVAKLESELGYDPFTLMEEPFYPTTLQQFIDIYEKFNPRK